MVCGASGPLGLGWPGRAWVGRWLSPEAQAASPSTPASFRVCVRYVHDYVISSISLVIGW